MLDVFGKIRNEIEIIRRKNSIILGYKTIPARPDKVNLDIYHPEIVGGGQISNLGDYLSEVIVEYLLHEKGLSLDKTVSTRKHLYAVGSIMMMGYQDATIWGTGMPYEPSFVRGFMHRSFNRKLDIRAVRGPKTRNTLISLGHDCPACYGDPACLMPLCYQPLTYEKKYKRIIIPHYQVERRFDYSVLNESDKVISMNTKDYKLVIDCICASDLVVSSSLHGIILAEAYGIPAVFYEDRPRKFTYKYEDWYLSTGRENFMKIKSLKELDEIDKRKLIIPDLRKIQESIKNSFPFDLFN